MRKFGPLTAIMAAASLTACVENTELEELPSMQLIAAELAETHEQVYRRPAKGLRVGQIHRAPVLLGREDYLVCSSTIEETIAPRYDNRGNLLVARGTPFRQSHASVLRLYPHGWGSTLYRRFESEKIGLLQIADYCPQSERP